MFGIYTDTCTTHIHVLYMFYSCTMYYTNRGGRTIEVIGDHLDTVESPQMFLAVGNIRSNTTVCEQTGYIVIQYHITPDPV